MQISERFNLNKTQAELDFIDIDTDRDIPLFLAPSSLGKEKTNGIAEAKALFTYLKEPNATCLGMSRGKPEGNGVGNTDRFQIFDNLIKSRAIQTGLIQDLEDNVLFVDNFGKDKLSDMTTNIIRRHLISYSQDECRLHGIPLNSDVPSGYYWGREENDWLSEHTQMLVIDNKPILLAPKGGGFIF